MLRAIYNTRFGKFIWRQFKKLSIAASVSVTLKQLMGISYQSIQDMVSQIDLKPDRDAKHALVVTPICGNDAATVYISSLCESLKALGYTIHLLVYNQDSSPIPDRPY
ncbi:MAG: hypothetical protein LBV09_05495, partial [Deferribacteraceae bacterium]|nr:hypothetical protein [Deferribacteraceae bacterium]